MRKGRVKDSVIDEIHLKCRIEWKEKEISRSPPYSSEMRLYQISGLCPDGTFQSMQKGI